MAKQSTPYDLLVIGGGPAGYVGAIRAAQLGLKVACVERERLGGVCLNWGCIPTKALLANAEFYARLTKEADQWGIEADNVRHNWEKVVGRSRSVADSLNQGIHGLLKKNKIDHFEGHARIVASAENNNGQARVEIHDQPDHVAQTIEARHVLIATGARPRALPGAAFDGEKVINSRQAMTLEKQPESLLIIGAGAIGMEFAYFYNAFGTQVTVVEMQDRVVPVEDEEVSRQVARSFEKQGITIHTGHKTLSVDKTETGVRAVIAPADSDKQADQVTIEADKVLVAIGVQGLFDGLFDEKQVPIATEKHHIKVDARKPGATYETSVKGIYAVGDVIGAPWLAHVASDEAVVCVERIAGHDAADIDYDAIPGCTYCQPQIASLGKTEQALKAQDLKPGLDYHVGKFPFMASGKAKAAGHVDGFVKILSDARHGEILGVHMVGDNVTELIAEMGLAKRLEATVDEVIATMHAHPTLSEAIREAAMGTQSRMLHL